MDAYVARQELSDPSASISAMGITEDSQLIYAAGLARSSDYVYLIQPALQSKVEAAVFQIEDADGDYVGMGVYYSPTRAVACAHIFTSIHGDMVTMVCGEERVAVKVKLRNEGNDFAILESSSPRPFISIWKGNLRELRGIALVLVSYGPGIDNYQRMFENELAFSAASCVEVSRFKTHVTYSCPALKGKSGAALVLANGEDVQLHVVGIHQMSINAVARSALLLQNLTG
ncbi:hypothetical protein PHYSODRAFT_301395 [Phytophthora sojae]|uniref:Serine protease n=1 Tax=Phytophthora sojae (strain P6497) TaxID=1094619 RepID=G4ZD01_PHYSP|nr:hypothetical protein PHYSODRAFT_301395 [Phytophthora sojae]EGZ18949.1 hypothetical protein PHYSODRAFT_301395 [Phytophthora sojae]|eukprot:XP_009528007.1 hypothetical protein PHYSODRAFT_301395 [Phytophthora sojae]